MPIALITGAGGGIGRSVCLKLAELGYHIVLAGRSLEALNAVADEIRRIGREALVVRVSSDAIVAFDRRCPHLGCPVLWSAARSRFECPCHRAAFDARTGAVLFGPPRRGLTPMEIV